MTTPLSKQATSDAIVLRDVIFSWAKTQLKPTLAISSWQVQQGQSLLLSGPSGCGKSTLLSLLTGIHLPQQGTVQLLGTSLNGLSQAKRDQFRADHLGYIFQQFNLLPYLNVSQNIVLPLQFSKQRKQRVEQQGGQQQAVHQLCQSLDLDESLLNQPVSQLSVGQQQRVAAARALIGAPEIIIADEPTSALDPKRRDHFLELLFHQTEKQGSTLVLVSHDPGVADHFNHHVDLLTLAGSQEKKR